MIERLWREVKAAFAQAMGGEVAEEEAPERVVSMMDVMDQVYASIWQSGDELLARAWPLDPVVDNGQLYAVVTAEGKLYRAKIDVDEATSTVILGEWQQIKVEHVPIETEGVRVWRLADGKLRFAVIANTAILNRVGEIDSKDLFDDFIRRAEESGQYPYVTFYHITHPDLLPTFRLGECDYLARDGVAYIASAILDESTPLGADIARGLETNPEIWGTSIGYDPAAPPEMEEIGGVKIPVYRQGEHKELSIILEEDAAGLFTAIVGEEAHMNEGMEKALKTLGLSEERVAEFAKLVDGVNHRVRTEGMISRDAPPEEPGEEAEVVEEVVETAEVVEAAEVVETTEVVLDEEALAEGLLGSEPFQGVLVPILESLEALGTKVEEAIAQITAGQEEALEPIRTRLEDLERTDDEKHKEWVRDLPAKREIVVTHRAPGRGDAESSKPETYEDKANKTLEVLEKAK